jgi:hypothetical protein
MEKIYDLLLPTTATDLDILQLLDENKLLRLHPHWFIEETERRNNALFATLRDYATEEVFSLGLKLETTLQPDDPINSELLMRVTLLDYGVKELLFFVQQEKTKVRVRFDDEQPDDELEQNILLWIRAMQEYLRLYATTTPHTVFFRLLMNRMILQMNPSQRKICLMITKITVIELVVIIVLVVGYVYFSQ